MTTKINKLNTLDCLRIRTCIAFNLWKNSIHSQWVTERALFDILINANMV